MKKLQLALIATTLIILNCVMAYADDSIKATLDGTEIVFDQPPIIVDGRTLVPIRAISEALGAEVVTDFTGETKLVAIHIDEYIIAMAIDENIALVDGEEVYVDVPPTIINDRTLVPIRFISEAFNLEVDWDGEAKVIYLASATTESEDVEQIEAVVATQEDYYNRLFKLSDEDIIKLCKESLDNDNAEVSITVLRPIDSQSNASSSHDIRITTPLVEAYEQVLLQRALTLTANTFAEDKAIDAYRTAARREVIKVVIRVETDNYEYDDKNVVIAYQGDARLGHTVLDGWPERTRKWPESPAYYRVGVLSLSYANIDFTKPLVVTVGGYSYTFDLSQIK